MRNYDFAPLNRSTVGFDRVFDLLDSAFSASQTDEGYPPYNIAKTGETSYRIDLAVAGRPGFDTATRARARARLTSRLQVSDRVRAALRRGEERPPIDGEVKARAIDWYRRLQHDANAELNG